MSGPRRPLFELGEIITTPTAASVLKERGDVEQEAGRLLARHHYGDWGDIADHERQRNQRNLKAGQICSAYGYGPNRLYVVTAPDRSNTVIKTPFDI